MAKPSDKDAKRRVAEMENVADVAASGIPLESGLRALAEEVGFFTGKRLNHIADRLGRGESLEEILAVTQSTNLRFLIQALKSASKSGDPGNVVVELAEYESNRRQLFHGFWVGVAYPMVLLLVGTVVLFIVGLCFMPAVSQTIDDFERVDGGTMRIIQWLSRYSLQYIGMGFAGAATYVIAARWWLGKPRWRWLLSSMPVIGPVTFWSGAWDFAVRLRILVERSMPMPQALRIVADTCQDANFADVARRLARGKEAGQSMVSQMQDSTRVPASLTNLIGWGETHGKVPESLKLAADLFQRRLQLRLEFLTSVLPPITFVAIAGIAITTAALVVTPLLYLVQMLSSFPLPPGGATRQPMLGATTLGLSVFGLALWWTVHVLFLRKRQSPEAHLIFALRIAAVIMIFAGLSNVILTVGFPVSLIIVLASGVVWLMVVNRFRKSETRSFLLQLSLAREHGLSIIEAAKAFAAERTDEIGLRAMRLVEQLERGVPFSQAMQNARFPATTETLFATSFGLSRSEAVSSMRDSAHASVAPSDITVGLLQRLMYLSFLPVFGVIVWAFLCIQIIPSFAVIFQDFELELPRVTQLAINATDAVTQGGLPSLIVYSIGLTMIVCLSTAIVALLFYYMGWLRWEPPLIRRFTVGYHGSIILRSLANAIDSNRDIPDALEDITVAYPTYYVRQRLIAAADLIERGQPWVNALRQQKLISHATEAVLASAERAGNLPWAMREMADAATRRLLLRINTMVHVVTPLILLAVAVPIGFGAVAIFAPLCNLIMRLS